MYKRSDTVSSGQSNCVTSRIPRSDLATSEALADAQNSEEHHHVSRDATARTAADGGRRETPLTAAHLSSIVGLLGRRRRQRRRSKALWMDPLETTSFVRPSWRALSTARLTRSRDCGVIVGTSSDRAMALKGACTLLRAFWLLRSRRDECSPLDHRGVFKRATLYNRGWITYIRRAGAAVVTARKIPQIQKVKSYCYRNT